MPIDIAWIGTGAEPDGVMSGAAAALAREYATGISRIRLAERPSHAFDAVRQQHSSRVILAWLATRVPARGGKLLGVTDVDLFIPVLTFVFGEAQLGGQVAVVSTARLCGGTDAGWTAARLIKEAVHEVGHTFGLVHCASPSCVMTRSPGVAAVDRKDERLCGSCRVRYREL